MQRRIRQWFQDAIDLRQKILAGSDDLLRGTENAALLISDCFRKGKKLLICGNGGSAADSQHLAAEFIVRYKAKNERRALSAMALTTDTSLLTACANDFSFDDIFSRQVEGLGARGDVLIAISTSGNSENIIRAVKAAVEKGMEVIKLLGGTGGSLKESPGLSIVVPAAETSRIQEIHITIGHMICELVESELFGF